jgi:hypothetical protein
MSFPRAAGPVRLLLAALAASPVWTAPAVASGAPIGAYTTRGAWSFVSAPTLHPPRLRTDSSTDYKALARGYFLTANFPNILAPGPMAGQSGPLILDSHLQPVWFRPASSTNVVALDLKQQTFAGHPALSWWEGVINNVGATVSGTVFVVDQHYRQVAKLTGDLKDGWVISPHEVVISGHDAWVTAYRYVPHVDLSAYGGSTNGTVYDSAVQEYDLRTGKLLYTWDALNPGGVPNIPLSDSEQPPPPPAAPAGAAWDAYHVNSIQLLAGGRFLVSMRNTWAAYLVEIKTGKIVWTLGGKRSTFAFSRGAQFQWQHQVTLLGGGLVTVFDDHCCKIVAGGKFAPPSGPARGLVLRLSFASRRVSLVHQYLRGSHFYVAFTGSTQLLPNGNVLVGWGSQPYFSEFSRAGRLLLDAVWPGNKDQSYRALFTGTWVGTPFYPPSGAVRVRHGRTTVYASWNGATQVVAWRVLAGADARHLKAVTRTARRGFETAITLPAGAYKVFRVQALGARGQVLGASAVFSRRHRSGLPRSY